MTENKQDSGSYQQNTVTLEIDNNLLLRAKSELDMGLDDFLEYALTMYLQHEDKYAKLFYEGAKKYSELKQIQDKMLKLDNNAVYDDSESYERAMETIERIHESYGHIGKDSLRHIANYNNISPNNLIKHVDSLGEFNITNFTVKVK